MQLNLNACHALRCPMSLILWRYCWASCVNAQMTLYKLHLPEVVLVSYNQNTVANTFKSKSWIFVFDSTPKQSYLKILHVCLRLVQTLHHKHVNLLWYMTGLKCNSIYKLFFSVSITVSWHDFHATAVWPGSLNTVIHDVDTTQKFRNHHN